MNEHHDANAPSASPAPRRRSYYAICALLALGTLVLAHLNWQQMRAVEPADGSSVARVDDDSAAAPPAAPSQEAGEVDPRHWLGVGGEANGPADAIHRGLGAGYEPLEREPADLEPPPDGERAWAFVRTAGELRQEVAAWRVDADSLDALAAFYQAQARARGLEPVASEPPAGAHAVRLLTFTTDDRPPRVLSVRLARRERDIHALIALR